MIKVLIVFIIVFGVLWIVNEIDEYYKENKIDLKEDQKIRVYIKRERNGSGQWIKDPRPGENVMIDKAIEVMKNKLECVKRNGECNQTCEEYNLVYKCDELVEIYEWVIKYLETKNNHN